MSYFANCRKCKKEIGNEDFRFELPYQNGYACFDCLSELDEQIGIWLTPSQE